jgi:methylenetetrahydrofolate dehydrogenase (NADP+)/methenyltetrahydrofolate cyclohydrolase
MQIIDGKAIAKNYEEDIKKDCQELKKSNKIIPGLAVVLVGDDAASRTYVKRKAEACQRVGIYSILHEMPEDISQESIEKTIEMMNENPNIDGILVQLPLPPHIDSSRILAKITPEKDVDGFHPYNTGRVVVGLDTFVPATPLGVMKLFEKYDIPLRGKECVVVGASNIVGKPMANLLVNAEATVTTTHIYTKDLKAHTKRADIVIVGVGKPNLITEDMIKDGAIVIDIGINRLESGKLVGDVDYEAVSKKCSYITPVPGGVGPMTIAMLLLNTLKAAKSRA